METNMSQEETVSLTIYFPKSMYQLLKKRVDVTGRSLTKETIHLINLGLKYGSEADARALFQLNQHLPKEIE